MSKLFIPYKDDMSPDRMRANFRTIEQWADGQLTVLSFSMSDFSNGSVTTPFPPPDSMVIKAIHWLLLTLGTGDTTVDFLVSGASIFPSGAPFTISHTGTGWLRQVLPRPRPVKTIQDILASRIAPPPDYLQSKVTTAGAGAADLYCGVEYD